MRIFGMATLLLPLVAAAATINVAAVTTLQSAIAGANPGDEIVIAGGTYQLTAPLVCARAGAAGRPILVRAQDRHMVTLTGSSAVEEIFRVTAPWWVFDGIDVALGASHGYKFDTDGHDCAVRFSRMIDNGESGVKGACGGPDTAAHCDRVTIEDCEIGLTAPTTNPACNAEGIDVVGGEGWIVRRNFIHNIAASAIMCPPGVGYGVFTKGNAKNSLFEDNLLDSNFIGLSFGGGGTDPCSFRGAVISGMSCTPPADGCEENGGLMRNNVIVRSQDVGIYLNQACNARVLNNTLWHNGTDGNGLQSIDTRFARTSATSSNNLLNGPVRDRDGATHGGAGDLVLPSPTDTSFFLGTGQNDFRLAALAPAIDNGVTLTDVPRDALAVPRPQGPAFDVGAYERPPGGYPDGGLPLPGTGDGGTADGGGIGGVGGGGGVLPPRNTGCHCDVGAAAPSLASGAALAALTLVLSRRRRSGGPPV